MALQLFYDEPHLAKTVFFFRPFLKDAFKVFMNKRRKCICFNSPKVLLCCNHPFSIYYSYHKMYQTPSYSLMASLCSEIKVLFLPRFSPHHNSWSSGLIKRIHFVCITCTIQIKSYTSRPKAFWKFLTKLSGKRQSQVYITFGQNSLLLSMTPF